MDAATSDIRAGEFTSSKKRDSPTLLALLDPLPDDAQICSATADGAYAPRRCHTALLEHGVTAIFPIRSNGRLWREDGRAAFARNTILHDVHNKGLAAWKRRNGFRLRSRAEAKMRCLHAF